MPPYTTCQHRGLNGVCGRSCLSGKVIQHCRMHTSRKSMAKCLIEGCEIGTKSASGYCPCTWKQNDLSKKARHVKSMEKMSLFLECFH